jgi:hypothetical protein
MSIIYGLSGIALNHIKDWNPSYFVETKSYQSDLHTLVTIDKSHIVAYLESLNKDLQYQKHVSRGEKTIKVFVRGGSVVIDTSTGEAFLEKVTRRPVFYEFNFLHYNHAKRLWKWFSDAFAASLVILAISGLFMLKGKKGITGRGAWITAIGIIIPLILFLMYT